MNFKKLIPSDKEYPEGLRNIYDPPQLINVWGNLPDFNQHPPIAIVGSRKPTEYGNESAREIAKGLALAGFTIVSGLAYGIDSVAHRVTLDVKGVTVAVLGSGLKEISPKLHQKLAEEIVAKGGCVISEFDDTMPGLPFHYPLRNRIISGIALGTVIVEAAIDSGSLITARSSMDQGREVFAVPGPIGNINSRGTHKLIKDGAALIESAQDVIDILDSKLPNEWKRKFSGQSFGIGDKERKLLDLLNDKPLTVDGIVEKSSLKASEVASMLTALECAGLIEDREGKGYIRLITHD